MYAENEFQTFNRTGYGFRGEMSNEYKPDKGTKGGSCNRSACQKPGAEWFNHSTWAYYCGECAEEINRVNPEAQAMYGHALCTREQPQEGKLLTAEEIVQKHCNNHQLNTANLDFVKQKGIVNGTLMFKFVECMAEFAAQETAALQEKLESAEAAIEHLKLVRQLQHQQRDKLDEELVAVKKARDLMKEERNRALNDFASLQFSSVQKERRHLKELDSVRKERNDREAERNGMRNIANEAIKQRIEVTRQRDEAVKLLEKANSLIEGDLYNFLNREERAASMEIRQGLERLSSGETNEKRP